MARSSNPDNYPPYYGPALLSVAATGKPIRIPVDNPHRLKQRMYAFINAYDRNECNLMVPYERCKARHMRQVSITHEGNEVVLTSKNHGPEADAFRKAMEGRDHDPFKVPERTPEEDAALEAAMRGEVPPEQEHDEGLGDIRSLFTKSGDTNER